MPTLMKPVDPASMSPATDAGPRLYGVIDVIRPDRIAGWAIDRADGAAALLIDIAREGRHVATVRADRTRKDLERGGVGTGRYGFSFEIAPPLEPGFDFTLAATARAADGFTADLRRTGGDPGPTPDRRLLERTFQAVSRLGQPARSDASAGLDALSDVVQRLEVAQARIEATLSGLAAPEPPSQAGLRILFAVTLAVALGSLALGVWSMLRP